MSAPETTGGLPAEALAARRARRDPDLQRSGSTSRTVVRRGCARPCPAPRARRRRQQPGRHRRRSPTTSPPTTRRSTCCTGRPRRAWARPTVAGFGWGLDQGYDVLVEMDADGSHQPEQLPALLAALPGADLVLGSRWVPGGSVVNWPAPASAALPGRQRLRPAGARIDVRDATGGFRAFRRDDPGEARPRRRREPGLLLPGGPRLAHRAGRVPGRRGAHHVRRAGARESRR